MHGDTYKIFVNDMDIGDVSYVPAFIYNKLPYIELDGLKYINPRYAYIDYLRMYTDPLMSFWRLQKAIPRGMVLLKNFPLEVGTGKIKYDILPKTCENLIHDLAKMLDKMDSVIHVGTYAIKFYSIDKEKDLLPYEIISVEYKDNVNKIYEELSKKYKIEIKEYFPYFQFWDRHVEFIHDGKVVLTIFRHNDRCIPYRKYDAGYIASFQQVFLHHLIKYYYYINNKLDYQNVNNILGEILRSRVDYLKKHNKTVMDDTIYREFQINCLGKALDPKRYAFVDMQTKLSQGKRIKWRYNPRTDYDLKLAEYTFDNTSGNLIKNPKLQTIKNSNTSEESESTEQSESSDKSTISENSVSTKPPMVSRSIFKKEDSETNYPFLDSNYSSEFI